jgi:DNA-binding transcriptional LysR family regulator
MREDVFPVCSPDLYSLASKAVCRLLQEAHEDSPEIDWRSWAPEFGLPDDLETKIVRYTSLSQVIGAAVAGAGLALGRSPLIDPELTSGRLVLYSPTYPGARPGVSYCGVGQGDGIECWDRSSTSYAQRSGHHH